MAVFHVFLQPSSICATSYDFTSMWDIKLKIIDRQQYGGYLRKGGGGVTKGKGDQIYGDRR